jgi:hypothetical protein
VAYGAGLESQLGAIPQGFKSLILRFRGADVSKIEINLLNQVSTKKVVITSLETKFILVKSKVFTLHPIH